MSQAMANAIRLYRLPILAGLLIGTSFIPFYPWAVFFCLTPLFLFWWSTVPSTTHSYRQAFFAGWLTQFILNLIGFHWIAYTAIEFGHFPLIGGLLSLVGFAAIAHLYYPVAGLAGRWLIMRFKIQGLPALFVYVFVFAFTDRVFSKIFPWHLGYPWLWAGWSGAQFTDVIGFEGLNFATILVNGLLAWAVAEGLLRYSKVRRKPWLIFGVAAGLVAALNVAGFGRAAKWGHPDSEVRVLAVQGNIGNFEKYIVELHSEFGVPILRKYLDLSRQAIAEHPDAQIMLWPETAFPSTLDTEYLGGALQRQTLDFIRAARMPLLTGAYSQKYGTRDVFNGFFHFTAQGFAPQTAYRKSILLVFGETFPFSEYIPYMEKLFPEQGSFTRGSGPTLMRVKRDGVNAGIDVLIGPQICYEGLYPWFSSELAQKGAEIFTNVTNDSWFWSPFEPNQHLYITLGRVIEFRRPLVRATNTGITTAMLATGEILEKSPIGRAWFGEFKIPYQTRPEHTVYERYGWLWPWLMLLALVATLAWGALMNRRDWSKGRVSG